jgi:predicted Fe-Mo cluster-binding NifX family protein
MRIVITAQGNDMNGQTSPRFGRCPYFIVVDTETMGFEVLSNPAISASGGAGIQAAQFIIEQGAQALLTGNVGPNAADVFRAAGLPIYLNNERTVQASVEAFKAGRLSIADGANVAAHSGMGMGQGRGRGLRRATPPTPLPASRDEEIAELGKLASDLRQQLADVIDRIEKLEKEN